MVVAGVCACVVAVVVGADVVVVLTWLVAVGGFAVIPNAPARKERVAINSALPPLRRAPCWLLFAFGLVVLRTRTSPGRPASRRWGRSC